MKLPRSKLWCIGESEQFRLMFLAMEFYIVLSLACLGSSRTGGTISALPWRPDRTDEIPLWSKNSPPQTCSFAVGTLLNISYAVMLLVLLTIFIGLYAGTDCTRKCTWSFSTPISRKFISYLFAISKHISLNTKSTSSVNTTRRYLAGTLQMMK